MTGTQAKPARCSPFEGRIEAIKRFEQVLEEALYSRDAKHFSSIIGQAMRILDCTPEEMQEGIGVSRPTISRWINGDCVPKMQTTRRFVYEWLGGRAARNRQYLESIAGRPPEAPSRPRRTARGAVHHSAQA